MMAKKKAVSALVATVLLILITVAAVGIIWGAIMPMMNRAMEMGQACLNARLSINTESGYTCHNITGNRVFVMVARGSEEFNLAGMYLTISGGGRSKAYLINETSTNPMLAMIDNAYGTALDLPEVNEERTYVINTTDFTILEEVKVAAIARVGNTIKACDVSSRVALAACGK
jgi:flagellin-like protein